MVRWPGVAVRDSPAKRAPPGAALGPNPSLTAMEGVRRHEEQWETVYRLMRRAGVQIPDLPLMERQAECRTTAPVSKTGERDERLVGPSPTLSALMRNLTGDGTDLKPGELHGLAGPAPAASAQGQ
jgi:hypothetical protein